MGADAYRPAAADEVILYYEAAQLNDGIVTAPADRPDLVQEPVWALGVITDSGEEWYPEPVYSHLTVHEALAVADDLGAVRVVGE